MNFYVHENTIFPQTKKIGLGLWYLTPLSTIFQWQSVLFVEETGVPGENYRYVASH
jgi:hypothetical protein